MSPHALFWHLLSLLLIPIFLSAAITVLKHALFPRRQGTAPHCAACDYLLIGNISGRCPECGRDLALPNSIRLGQGRRSRGLAIIGLFLLILGLLPFITLATRLARQIEWYPYRPTSWVVQDLTSSNPIQANRAWNELERRRKSPAGLSPSIEQKLIALALKDQAQPAQGPVSWELMNFVGDMVLANKLTQSQADLFFTQAMSLKLTARPVVTVGDNASYMVHNIGRGPSKNWWCRVHRLQAKVGEQVSHAASHDTMNGFAGGGSGSYVEITAPGKHTLETTHRIEFYHGPYGDEKSSKLHYARIVTLKTDFQALEKAPSAISN